MRDFAAIWQAAEKIVYSSTLEAVSTTRTRIEREFDPDAVRHEEAAAGSDLIVGGAGLAAEAFGAGLVDESIFLTPVVVGGGTHASPGGPPPRARVPRRASLPQRRRLLHYRIASSEPMPERG